MKARTLITIIIISIVVFSSCQSSLISAENYPESDRESALPADIEKKTPETDAAPPILHVDGYEPPIPLPYPVNTSGGEDSPFILPDGKTLYFFFTPDVRVPHNQQLLDGVTGIWVTTMVDGSWTKPERVWLQDAEKLALDGAPYVNEDTIWFASAREGYTGMNIFTAKKDGDKFKDWELVDEAFSGSLMVGELHIFNDELYYHSDRAGGKGSFDIWMIRKTNDGWSEPENILAVNTNEFDGYPYISPDGSEMWFTRVYMGTPAVFRSYRVNGIWQEPELIVSQFAGEPTLDEAGNLYFVHHYYENGVMIEADIYVAYKKDSEMQD